MPGGVGEGGCCNKEVLGFKHVRKGVIAKVKKKQNPKSITDISKNIEIRHLFDEILLPNLPFVYAQAVILLHTGTVYWE